MRLLGIRRALPRLARLHSSRARPGARAPVLCHHTERTTWPHSIRRSESKAIGGTTPFERWTNNRGPVSHMKAPGPALRVVLRTPNLSYRWHVGWLLGHRFVQIEHTGRRSGARYHAVALMSRHSPRRRRGRSGRGVARVRGAKSVDEAGRPSSPRASVGEPPTTSLRRPGELSSAPCPWSHSCPSRPQRHDDSRSPKRERT
jgi:hypothetical protein